MVEKKVLVDSAGENTQNRPILMQVNEKGFCFVSAKADAETMKAKSFMTVACHFSPHSSSLSCFFVIA
jgi:hypothetical protein